MVCTTVQEVWEEFSRFLNNINQIDKSLKFICQNGACYRFAKFVKEYFTMFDCYISENKQHVIVGYGGKYFDINGEHDGKGYSLMTTDDVKLCEEWSFSRNYFVGKECPMCGEIIE